MKKVDFATVNSDVSKPPNEIFPDFDGNNKKPEIQSKEFRLLKQSILKRFNALKDDSYFNLFSKKPNSNSVDETEDILCVICIDEKKTRASVPCGHCCICDNCPHLALCPICRIVPEKWMKIYN